MTFKIWDREYKKIYRLHNLAIEQIEANSIEQAHQNADEALQKLENHRHWSLSSAFSKNLVYANLYFIRAQSREENEPMIEKYFSIITSDYKHAIDLLKNEDKPNDTFFSAISAYSNLLIKQSIQTDNSYWKEAYYYLMLAKQASETVFAEFNAYQAQILSQLSTCLGSWDIHNPVYDVNKAIDYLKISHGYYENHGDRQNLLSAKRNLALFYYNRASETNNSSDIERACFFIQNYMEICDEDDKSLSLVAGFLGDVFSIKKTNARHVNIEIAIKLLNFAHGNINPDKHPMAWSRVGINLINCLLQQKEWSTVLKNRTDIKNICDNVIQQIFEILEESFEPKLTFEALSTKKRMGKVFDSYSIGDNLNNLNALSQKIKGDKNFEELWIDIQLERAREFPELRNIEELIAIYEDILSTVDINKWPVYCFDVYLELGKCFIEQNNSEKASENYKNALELLFQYRQEHPTISPALLRKKLISGDRSILTISFRVLKTDDPILALQYQEFLRFHPVVDALEELLIIEHQTNRKHWIFKHKMTKMAELVLNTMDADANKKETIDKIDHYYQEFGALKNRFLHLTEFSFISHIEQEIEKLSSWVLVPVLDKNLGTLLLIPPHSKPTEIIVSEPISCGWVDILKKITAEKENSWIACTTEYETRLRQIASIRDEAESENQFNDFQETLDSTFEQVQLYLWDIFGRWIQNTLLEMNITFPVPLSIVAQGSLTLLPFGMAKNPETGKHLFDIVDISYVPSLYALFSLQNRLKFWKYPEKLGFIADTSLDHETNEFKLLTWPIEQKLCFSAFNDAGCEKTTANSLELNELRRVSAVSTHWHFCAHGSFDNNYYEKSYIELTDGGKITPSLLAALDPKEYLRLVILSACQTAVSEMLDKELSPESFLTELLKSGTIGAIGTLWQVPDISASLILGRFYHFHLSDKQEPSSALRSAQTWLRDITFLEYQQFVELFLMSDEACRLIALKTLDTLKQDNYEDCDCPFSNPFYWAGFILVGQ